MPKIRSTIEIDAPVSEVFAYFAAVEHLPEFWPSIVEVSNIEENPDGSKSFDWVYNMLGMHFRGHSVTTEFQRDRLAVTKTEQGIKSTIRWQFEPRGDATVLTSELDYEIPGALLGRLAAPVINKLNERVAAHVLENLKMRMEAPREARLQEQPHV